MKHLAFLILFVYALGVNAQPAHVLHKSYAVQHAFLDSLWSEAANPANTNVEFILKEMEKWGQTSDDHNFRFSARLFVLKFKVTNGQFTKELEKDMLELAAEARQKKWLMLEADALRAMAEYWIIRKKYGLSFEYDLAAYNLYEKMSAEDFPPKQSYLYLLGMHYVQYGDNDKAFRLLKEAVSTTPFDGRYVNPINNALGMYYRNTKNYDSARWYFQRVYDNAVKSNDTQWIGIPAGNIGICYFFEKEYEKAIPLLERDIEFSLYTNQVQNAVHSMNVLAEIYLIQAKIDKADEWLQKSLSLARSKSWWPNYKLAGETYSLLSKLHARKNNIMAAYLYGDSAITAKDSFNAQYNALSIAKAQEKIEIIQHKLDAEHAENQRKTQELVRNALMAGMLLLAVIGILFINRQKQRHKRLEAEKKNIETELAGSRQLLENFRQGAIEKNRLIEQFNQELSSMKQGVLQQDDNELLMRLEHSVLLTDEQWADFQVLFEKVHNGFFKRVKEKIPDLTPAELRFVALSKLKLNPKEMATMLGISAGSIRNYRHRLRKKLDLDEDASFEDIADAI